MDQDVAFVQEKMDILVHDYYASVYQGDLGSEKTNRDITHWMRNQTSGMLKKRTGNEQLDSENQMLLMASTIYFQSKWGDEFNKSNNIKALFHALTGDIECTYHNFLNTMINNDIFFFFQVKKQGRQTHLKIHL